MNAGTAVRRSPKMPELPVTPPRMTIPRPDPITEQVLPAGNPKRPTRTMLHILRATYLRDGRQTLVHAGKRFWLWNDSEPGWRPLEEDDLSAVIYRALRDNCWIAGEKHVRSILAAMRLELHWPPPTMRCAA